MPEKQANLWLVTCVALYLLCLTSACCVLIVYFAGAGGLPGISATPTLDLACADADCMQVCLERIPFFGGAPLYGREEDLQQRPSGYEIARYRLDPATQQLARLAAPSLPDYLQPYQQEELHRRIWDYYVAVFPQTEELHISYMVVYTDGIKDGYAGRIWNLDGKWRLYVDILDFRKPSAVTDILTHEHGHMLTLNDAQLRNIRSEYGLKAEREDFDKMQSQCEGFFNGEACAGADSYMNAFGQRFWNGALYEDWITVYITEEQGDGNHDRAVKEFHSRYPGYFVTEYAATNPDEDIAESWTAFVMEYKPRGASIAEQKILFFYDYPELVELRRQILQNVCRYAARTN